MTESLMAIIALRAVLPKNLSALTVQQIVELKEKHRAELTAFQDFLQGVANSNTVLSAIGAPAEREALTESVQVEYERNIASQLLELERSMKRMGLSTAWNALSIKTAAPPFIAQAAAQLFGGNSIVHTTMVAAGVTVAAMGLVRDSHAARSKLRKDSSVAYLLSLKNVDAKTIPELANRAPKSDFVNGFAV